MKIRLVIIALIIACFEACDPPGKGRELLSDSVHIEPVDLVAPPPVEYNEDTIAHIEFKEFSVSIDRLLLADAASQAKVWSWDTVSVVAELGESIEGQKIRVDPKELRDVTVEQRYETSVSIMDEGPHCDLVEWKHYTSDWKSLPLKDGSYIGDSYPEDAYDKFPDVSVEELKRTALEHCGEEWKDQISKIRSLREYPSSVGLSRYFLRITGRNAEGKIITKLIIIEIAMGC